jgi:hypothetical protein
VSIGCLGRNGKREDGREKIEDRRWKREDRRWKREDRRWKREETRWHRVTVTLMTKPYSKSQVPSNKFQINNQVTNFKLQTITKEPITKQLRLSDNWLIANC